jgi:hypothetical protein
MRRPGTAMALRLAAERRRTRGFWRRVLPEFRAMHSAARDERAGTVRSSLDPYGEWAHIKGCEVDDALTRQLDAQILGPLDTYGAGEIGHRFVARVPCSPELLETLGGAWAISPTRRPGSSSRTRCGAT